MIDSTAQLCFNYLLSNHCKAPVTQMGAALLPGQLPLGGSFQVWKGVFLSVPESTFCFSSCFLTGKGLIKANCFSDIRVRCNLWWRPGRMPVHHVPKEGLVVARIPRKQGFIYFFSRHVFGDFFFFFFKKECHGMAAEVDNIHVADKENSPKRERTPTPSDVGKAAGWLCRPTAK